VVDTFQADGPYEVKFGVASPRNKQSYDSLHAPSSILLAVSLLFLVIGFRIRFSPAAGPPAMESLGESGADT